jgi:hypothetical protein
MIIATAMAFSIAVTVQTLAGSDTGPAPDRHAQQTSPQRIAVIGDSLAQDLWNGLHKLYRGAEGKVEFIRFTKVSSGLVRDDVYNWNQRVKTFVAENDFDTAIVLMGGNDRQVITAGKKRLERFGEAWTAEYARRVDDFIATLKSETKSVYWLGLPVVRSKRMARDYQKLNKVYRSQADANDIVYIDTWPLFEDKEGKYTSFGQDLKGVKRRLRKDDGLHFTVAGKLVFAREIVRLLRKEVSAVEPHFQVPSSVAEPDG